MKIINLVEDTKGNDCLHEHGLSFYIETKKHKLLVDSGASDIFLQNADKSGIDLTQVDTFILSHGHYDHAGGLMTFAKINSKAEIYLKKTAAGDYYHISPGDERYIGIDKNIMKLPQIITVDENMEIDEELFLFSDFTEKQYPEWSNQQLKQKIEKNYIQDSFQHEQCLVVTCEEQKILLSGCAHNGILSILSRYHQIFGSYPQKVISGFHMMKKSDYTAEEVEYIRKTAYKLLETEAMFYTGHCTGDKAFDIMKEIMGERLIRFWSGANLDELSA